MSCFFLGSRPSSFDELGVELEPRFDFSVVDFPVYYHMTDERFLSPRCGFHAFCGGVRTSLL